MGIILLLVLIVLVIGALPSYGYSRTWGYRPSGLLGLLLIVVIVLVLLGSIPWGFRRTIYGTQRPVIVQPPPVRVITPPAEHPATKPVNEP